MILNYLPIQNVVVPSVPYINDENDAELEASQQKNKLIFAEENHHKYLI
jgi:hypothetical protein